MKLKQNPIMGLLFLMVLVSCKANYNNTIQSFDNFNDQNMMVRIAEIEIHPEYLADYIAILKVEAEASIRLEAGVICIYPMFQKDNPTQIRLLEIYADKAAYEAHLQSPHLKHYKSTTLPMVKSLRLVEMQALDPENMDAIFKKLLEN